MGWARTPAYSTPPFYRLARLRFIFRNEGKKADDSDFLIGDYTLGHGQKILSPWKIRGSGHPTLAAKNASRMGHPLSWKPTPSKNMRGPPAMGRFMSPDWSDSPVPIPSASLADPQSLNLYSYTRNNPVTRKDDDGHCDDDGGRHDSLWCILHALGFVESDAEKSARIENERNALLGGTHADGTSLTPAEKRALQGASQDQIDQLYTSVLTGQVQQELDSRSRELRMFPWTVANIDSNWHEGSFDSSEESLNYHFETHGEEVGADSESDYLGKAEAFKSNLKGAQKSSVEGVTDGVTRYTKNGKYIDLAQDGRIVSFGKQ